MPDRPASDAAHARGWFRRFGKGGTVAEDDAGITGARETSQVSRPAVQTELPHDFVVESRERFYRALADIALSPDANEWSRKRAAEALYVITDPPPEEALELGRELARKYGW